MATFLKMAVAYKKKIGFGAQFTIEPKAREPTAHQYDYDAQTVIGFLYQLGAPEGYGTAGSVYSSLISWFTLCRSATLFQKLSKITKTLWFVFGALCCSCLPFVHLGLRHGLQNEFKVNIEPNHTTLAGKLQGEARKLKIVGSFFGSCGRFLRILYLSTIEHLHWVSGHDYEHDLRMASALGMLGSIDCNAGQPYLGWDTDEFPSDPRTWRSSNNQLLIFGIFYIIFSSFFQSRLSQFWIKILLHGGHGAGSACYPC